MNTNGVPQERLDRLMKHLYELEKQTGQRLRTTPRYYLNDCPIENFAPGKGFVYVGGTPPTIGKVYYSDKIYKIYEGEESEWWKRLPRKTRWLITKWVSQQLKERIK